MYKLKCSVCGKDIEFLLYTPSKVLYECPHCKSSLMIKCACDGINLTIKNIPQVSLKNSNTLNEKSCKKTNKDSSTVKSDIKQIFN